MRAFAQHSWLRFSGRTACRRAPLFASILNILNGFLGKIQLLLSSPLRLAGVNIPNALRSTRRATPSIVRDPTPHEPHSAMPLWRSRIARTARHIHQLRSHLAATLLLKNALIPPKSARLYGQNARAQ